ncbi:MAG: transposase [Bacteroidota bacterium]
MGNLPSLPLPKSNAGPSLLAYIMVSKWVDHLPYYRQIQLFKREGVTIAKSTFNGWFNGTAHVLHPLYEELVRQVQGQDDLQADESTINVQDGHNQGATHLGYQWVYHAPKTKRVVFDYQPSCFREGPAAFLVSYRKMSKKP